MEVKRDFIFDPSLALYLPLYELDGASFMSKDAHGHLCTVTGALWRHNGRWFDGNDDAINLGNPTVLNLSSAWTYQAWFKCADTSGGNAGILSKDDAVKRDFFVILLTTGVIRFTHHISNAGNYVDTTLTYDDDSWHFGTFINDGTDLIIDVDGTTVIGAGKGGATDNDGANFYVGSWRPGTGEAINGMIGEALGYSCALTPLEIQHNYEATKWRYR